MNIYLLVIIIFVIFYLFLSWFSKTSSKKIAKIVREFTLIISLALAILFVFGGRYLLSLPIFAIFLSTLKIKGLSAVQIFRLWSLIQYLRTRGRFSFGKNSQNINTSSQNLSLNEAYKILNLNPKKKYSKKDVRKAYLKIMKKIHPDVSPNTAKLSEYVNAAKDLINSSLS
jgi:hypothetical protein